MLFKPDHLNLRFQWQNFIYFSIINPARLFHRSSLAWNESQSNTGAGQHTHLSRNQVHNHSAALYHAISYFSSKKALRRIARVLPLSIADKLILASLNGKSSRLQKRWLTCACEAFLSLQWLPFYFSNSQRGK